MAKNGEAVDAVGRPLLTQDEVARLEHYYGTVDPVTKQVEIRRLNVPITCSVPSGRSEISWTIRKWVWVWDWGRSESPTEPQIRNIERETGCNDNNDLRKTLIDVYQQAEEQCGVRGPDRPEGQDRAGPGRSAAQGGRRRQTLAAAAMIGVG